METGILLLNSSCGSGPNSRMLLIVRACGKQFVGLGIMGPSSSGGDHLPKLLRADRESTHKSSEDMLREPEYKVPAVIG
jgi:hypothetical protein